MALESNQTTYGHWPAAADLSTHQYKFVTLNTSGQVALLGSAGGATIGILQNTPAAGQPATVAVFGESKCKFGATIAIGENVTPTAAALGAVATTGNYVAGIATKGAGNTEVGSVLLLHHGIL